MLKDALERFQLLIAIVSIGAGGAWVVHGKLSEFPTREEISSIKSASISAIDERYRVSIDLMQAQQQETRNAIAAIQLEQKAANTRNESSIESLRVSLRSLNDKLFQMAIDRRAAARAVVNGGLRRAVYFPSE